MVLGVLDIIILVSFVFMSIAIGVYHGIKGIKQSSIDYMLGGRRMSPIPLAMSLTVGVLSAITIMGNAGEMYAFGTQIWMMDLGVGFGMIFVAKYFLPILYPLKMVSLYHYIEARFHSIWLKRGTVLLTLLSSYLFIGFLLYPPSLFLQYFTGFSSTLNIVITGIACSIYSSIGGVKAVVYTDVLQCIVMILGVLAIVIQGALSVGGLDKAWDIAYHRGRIELFNFDLDPYQRHSFWLVIIYGFFFGVANYGVLQSQIQRTFSTPTIQDAKRVVYYAMFGMVLLKSLVNLSGVIIYAFYAGCDPLTMGTGPTKPNLAIVIIYVLENLTKIPGLSGLFVASIYAAVLSSVSTQLNSLTALLWEDFLKNMAIFQNKNDVIITRIQKVIVLLTGVIGILSSLLVSKFQSFLKDLLQLAGAVSGPLVGLFLIAVYLPWVKKKGAILGFLISIIISLWIVTGQLVTQPSPVFLPMSHEGCKIPQNSTQSELEEGNSTSSFEGEKHYSEAHFHKLNRGVGFYGVSYCLNYCWGTLSAVLIAILCAVLTHNSEKDEEVRENLINPTMWRIYDMGLRNYLHERLTSTVKFKRTKISRNSVGISPTSTDLPV